MVSLAQLKRTIGSAQSHASEYICQTGLNLYQSPACHSLVTQAAAGRHLRPVSIAPSPDLEMSGVTAIEVRLCEDDYPGWLAIDDLHWLAIADTPYRAVSFSFAEIQARLPGIIAFCQRAMAQPNRYLWGGTIGPDYDCSGLMQAAFASVGIYLPRDSYQQHAFTRTIPLDTPQPGDLIFFGPPEKTTHVALYLGEGNYIHSSGKDQGRNGVGIDSLINLSDPVSQAYSCQLRGAGRVMNSYQPQTPNRYRQAAGINPDIETKS